MRGGLKKRFLGKGHRVGGLVIGMLVGSLTVSMANGFRNPPEGAAALGLGGGKIVTVNDTTALAHNPANLFDIESPTYSLHLAIAVSGTDYDSPMGVSDETESPLKFLPNIFAVFPTENKDLTWGIAVTTPYGQFTEWEKDKPFRGTAPYFASLLAIDVAPTVAYRVNDALTVAAGVDLMYSELEFKQIFPWGMALGGPFGEGRASIDGSGVGIGANAAIQLQLAEGHRAALTYTSPIEIDYDGDFDIGSIPPPASGLVAGKSDFESEIKFPTVVALGYGWEVSETFRIGADVEWIEFSNFDELPLDLGRNNPAGLFPPAIPEDWDDTITARFGVEWDQNDNWVWRAGYIWLESPVPESTMAPTLPDADRHVLSLGLGYHDERQTIDVAYAYSIYDDIDIDSNANPAYVGDYEQYAHLISLSYGKSF
jgi:long-chain fatty acid transport protein